MLRKTIQGLLAGGVLGCLQGVGILLILWALDGLYEAGLGPLGWRVYRGSGEVPGTLVLMSIKGGVSGLLVRAVCRRTPTVSRARMGLGSLVAALPLIVVGTLVLPGDIGALYWILGLVVADGVQGAILVALFHAMDEDRVRAPWARRAAHEPARASGLSRRAWVRGVVILVALVVVSPPLWYAFVSIRIQSLARTVRDRGPNLDEAISALVRIGPRASGVAPVLAELLADARASPWLKSSAASALPEVGASPELALPVLTAALETDDPWLWGSVARALGRVGPPAHIAVPRLLERIWDRRVGEIVEAAVLRIDPESHAVAEKRRMFRELGTYLSRVDLLMPEDGRTISSSSYQVAFRWSLVGARPDWKYCSVLFTDKGPNPLDGGYERRWSVGEATELSESLGSYWADRRTEWAVEVTACRDLAATCKNSGEPCEGRVFSSAVRAIHGGGW